jgi:glycosyltransferase involved in cell wall biosynthesis
MQETIRRNFGVDAELQPPATERRECRPARPAGREISIVYAGSITSAVEDNLKLLASLITSGKLSEHGVDAKLHLYTVLKQEQRREWGWDHPNIVIHAWVVQAELPGVLCTADILFLPFSFAPEERHTVETAFPSKTADYLASGTPILVFGPKYSTLVGYARREGFGEIVMEADGELLVQAIQRVAGDPGHREMLSRRALAVFSKYHDMGRQRADFVRLLNTIVRQTSAQAVSNRA